LESQRCELTRNTGWKVVLSPRVPKLTSAAVSPTFNKLLQSLPKLPPHYKTASDFDWALHPGGATILSGVEKALNIAPEHMRASYDTYINHGNSSSATIFSVMDRLRQKDMDKLAPDGKAKDFVVGCAFGPGIVIEMCMLKRNMSHIQRTLVVESGEATPSHTESERSEGEAGQEIEIQIEMGSMEGKDEELGEKLRDMHPEVPQQGDSLSEALNGVELD
jgi:type III polyketide synthase